MIQTMVKSILLSLFSALFLILSFPRFDLSLFAWFALVPLFVCIRDKGLVSAFGYSLLTGLIFFMGIFYWSNDIAGFKWHDFILMGLYLGSYIGLFGFAFNFIAKRSRLTSIVIAPVLWVSIEYIRSHAGFLALPWALLGHSQYLNTSIIQISALTGVYGVSFLIVMVNATVSEFIQRRMKVLKPAIVTLLVLVISVVYGQTVISGESNGGQVSVTVIQGNIPQNVKWSPEYLGSNLGKHIRLTREASEKDHASLTVWPEATVPVITQQPVLLKAIIGLSRETNAHILVGSSQRPKFGSGKFSEKWSNSAFMISPSGMINGPYDKIQLVPFSEYLPLKDVIPWPTSYVSGASSFSPGIKYTLFNVDGARLGVTICWENLFPDLFRQFVLGGAEFMVNMTNEARMGETAAPYQIAAINVFRAVENRVAIARSANSGISCFIDPYGRITGRVKDKDKDIFVEGYLTRNVPLSRQKTFYTMYGDIFAYLNFLVMLLIVALSFLKRGRA